MTTHLFAGADNGDSATITSFITLCCHKAAIGFPKGDKGTVDPELADCDALTGGE